MRLAALTTTYKQQGIALRKMAENGRGREKGDATL